MVSKSEAAGISIIVGFAIGLSVIMALAALCCCWHRARSRRRRASEGKAQKPAPTEVAPAFAPLSAVQVHEQPLERSRGNPVEVRGEAVAVRRRLAHGPRLAPVPRRIAYGGDSVRWGQQRRPLACPPPLTSAHAQASDPPAAIYYPPDLEPAPAVFFPPVAAPLAAPAPLASPASPPYAPPAVAAHREAPPPEPHAAREETTTNGEVQLAGMTAALVPEDEEPLPAHAAAHSEALALLEPDSPLGQLVPPSGNAAFPRPSAVRDAGFLVSVDGALYVPPSDRSDPQRRRLDRLTSGRDDQPLMPQPVRAQSARNSAGMMAAAATFADAPLAPPQPVRALSARGVLQVTPAVSPPPAVPRLDLTRLPTALTHAPRGSLGALQTGDSAAYTSSLAKLTAEHAAQPIATDAERFATILCNRAAARLMLSAFEGALQDCRAALERRPGFPRAIARAATCHMRLGRFAEGRRMLVAAREAPGAGDEDRALFAGKLAELERFLGEADALWAALPSCATTDALAELDRRVRACAGSVRPLCAARLWTRVYTRV